MDVRAVFETLKSLYKFEYDLKDEQHTIISAILDGKDVSAILPTGYGKSVCYILPPLILDKVIIIFFLSRILLFDRFSLYYMYNLDFARIFFSSD
jgi:hypothetical protein